MTIRAIRISNAKPTIPKVMIGLNMAKVREKELIIRCDCLVFWQPKKMEGWQNGKTSFSILNKHKDLRKNYKYKKYCLENEEQVHNTDFPPKTPSTST